MANTSGPVSGVSSPRVETGAIEDGSASKPTDLLKGTTALNKPVQDVSVPAPVLPVTPASIAAVPASVAAVPASIAAVPAATGSGHAVSSSATLADTPGKTMVAAPAGQDSTALPPSDPAVNRPEKPDGTTITKRKKFYAGILGGADVSAIRLQDVKHAGYSFGVILGYQVNKKLAVETGLLRERKYYATSGEYFNPKEPVYTTVEYVSGHCNMWEIPINLVYKFRITPAASWAASIGTSTYLMRNETYVMNLNNNGVRYPHKFDYKNRTNTLFSVINLGAVYSRRLGNIGDLRLEPYLRLPVNRVGTGNMHVQSGGLLVGLTRTIF
ncbi:MAG: hypothetical protein EOO05_02785 [Chitinophagaceae bacterium]|nr:MAG: hypothetical protein EOO05_02785 [Chitinophagaceae bacterium]